jgi:hypothetical protein
MATKYKDCVTESRLALREFYRAKRAFRSGSITWLELLVAKDRFNNSFDIAYARAYQYAEESLNEFGQLAIDITQEIGERAEVPFQDSGWSGR